MLVNLFEPVVEIHKSAFVEQVKHKDDAISSFVIGIGDSAVSLLACGIPYLQLNLFSLVSQRSETKIHSNGRDIVLIKLIICKSN